VFLKECFSIWLNADRASQLKAALCGMNGSKTESPVAAFDPNTTRRNNAR
jgi:hypothetical protein